MPGFTRSITIDKPIKEVFDFATDLANAPLFLPGIVKTEMLTEGGMKPGARFRETRLMGKKERSAVIEVVDHQRPTIHSARSAMMGMSARYTFHFLPEGAGTRITMDAVVGGNLLWKLFLGMISRMMEKEDGDYLVRLKSAIESPK